MASSSKFPSHDANVICLKIFLPTPLLFPSRRGLEPKLISIRVDIAGDHPQAA